MPRAFLITRRRYDNGAEQFEETMRDSSPERGVSVAEFGGGQPTSDGASDCGSETSSECPEELYNLTKLAEVSLAAAAGTLIHPTGSSVLCHQGPASPCRRREVDDISELENANCNERGADGQALQERTRLFFERIEAERKIFERRSPAGESRGQRTVRDPTDQRESDETQTHRKTQSGTRKANVNVVQSIENSTKSDQENEDHECPDCGKRYSTSSNLARHRQTHRSLGDKKARRCPHCDKVYVSMPAFSMHVRTHNQGCKCHYCGKCFSRPWLLQGHIRTHTGEKPFKCTICNKAFADKSNLRAHIQTHSNTKPHVCGRCGKAFALKSYLYKHEESSCMRAAHQRDGSRASSEKRDTESSRCSPMPRRISVPVTASPTSVIVPRPQNFCPNISPEPPQTFSAIRHTKGSSPLFAKTETVKVKVTVTEKEKETDAETETETETEMETVTIMKTEEKIQEVIETTTTATATATETTEEKNAKRQALEARTKIGNGEIERSKQRLDTPEYRSQMVIRTSVISPNPEHLSRVSAAASGNKKSPFEFTASRTSAFSRPGGMTLNLALA